MADAVFKHLFRLPLGEMSEKTDNLVYAARGPRFTPPGTELTPQAMPSHFPS